MKSPLQIVMSASRVSYLSVLALCLVAARSARADYNFWAGVPGVSATTNWTDAANWTGAIQTYYNEVEFTGIGTSANNDFSVNNVLDGTTGVAQVPIWELDFVPTNGNYTTLIGPGVTLTLNAGRGYLAVGADQLHTASPAPANAFETITITGAGGTLSMAGNLYVNQGSPTPGDTHNVTLDLSGLDNFNDNGSGNEILVASGGAQRTHGTLYLAKTNQISLGNDFLVCNQDYSNSMPCAVYLGNVNTILTGSGNLTVAGTGTTTVGAWMKFNPAFLSGGNVPAASLGGTASDGRIVNFWICNANGGPQVAGYGLCDFTGGNVSLLARTMQLGQGGNTGANATGVLTLDNGLIDVNNATVGNQEASGGGSGVGIINLNHNATLDTNATLRVNNILTLAAASGSLTLGTAGTININGGALAANTISNGGGIGTINMTNGTITLTTVAGTAAAPLSSLSTLNSTLNLAVARTRTNVMVTSLTTGGPTNIVNITSVQPSASYPAQFTLIKFQGSIGGAGYNFGLGTVPLLSAGFLSNHVANGSVDLVLTSGPLTDTWTGSVNGNWDTTTLNWTAGGPVAYSDGAFVQFLDGASDSTVNLTTSLSPGGITISNTALTYTFNGSGELRGSTSLLKQGSGALVIDNTGSNDFSGGVTISGGTVQVGNNDTSGNLPAGAITDNGVLAYNRADSVTLSSSISGAGSFTQEGAGTTLLLSGANTFTGQVLVTNGSTLKLGSSSALGADGTANVASGSTLDNASGYTATKTIVVSGTGVGGNGALTDTGGSIYDNPGPGLATNIILAGDTTFSYPTRWDLGSVAGGSFLGTGGHPYNLTLNSSSGYFEWYNLALDSSLANITIQSGNLGVVGSTSFGNPSATLTIASGAALTFYGANVYANKQVDFQGGASINNGYGANIMNGAMTLEAGFCTFNIGGGTTLTISNVLSGTGSFYQSGGSGTTILWGNSPSFTGGVLLYNGQMTLNGTIGSGVTNQAGTTLSGKGSAAGLVDVAGAFFPGGATAAGTFTAGGGLTLEGSATLTMDLASSTGIGGGTNDLIAVTGDLTVNGNNISINPLTGTLANGTYTLFTYTGNLNGSFGTASTVASSRYVLTLDTSTAHQVKLIVSGMANLLAWNNGANNAQWDVQSSLNWTNLTTHVEDQFFISDAVLLDDRISQAPNPTTSLVIDSGQVVVPSVLTNNSTTNYTISGAGKISGGATVVKLGTSTLTINNTNDFTGNFTLAAGAVEANGLTSALGTANGTLTISNGAQLTVNLSGNYPPGDAGFGNKPIVVSGAGVNGQGAIQFTGGPLYNDGSTLGLGQSVTLAGNTTLSGAGRFDWGYPGAGTTLSSGGSNYNLTVSVGSYSQWYDIGIDPNLGNIDLYTSANSQQTLRVQALGASLGNPSNVLTLHSNVLFNIQHGDTTAGDNGYAKVVHILGTAAWQYQPSGGAGDYRLGTSFVLETNAGLYFFSGNGGNNSGTVINGTVTLNGLAHFQIGNSLITFSNVISGPGGFYMDNYGGNPPLVFAAANTYQGITDIRSGLVLALIGNGSIAASTNISLAASATLDVSARADKTLTLAAGQTLQGNGAINGNLVVGAGAAVSPGGANAIGTLTVTNAVTLSGTTTMELNKMNSSFDQISGAASIAYGGTLSVTNLAGSLAPGDSFKLFTAGSYSGVFAAISPATPGAGLAWDTSGLTNGTLNVAAAPTGPAIGEITVSGGNVIISGSNNTGSGGGTYHIVTTTNVALPATNWVVLTNGAFDNSGNFSSTNAVGTNAQRFYRLQVP